MIERTLPMAYLFKDEPKVAARGELPVLPKSLVEVVMNEEGRVQCLDLRETRASVRDRQTAHFVANALTLWCLHF